MSEVQVDENKLHQEKELKAEEKKTKVGERSKESIFALGEYVLGESGFSY